MRILQGLGVASVALMLLSCQSSHDDAANDRVAAVPCRTTGQIFGPAQPFPDWVGFPEPPGVVESWVANLQGPKTREHGYTLWAGLHALAPNGQPVWRTWNTSTQAFAAVGDGLLGASPAEATGPASLNARNRLNAAFEGEDPINFEITPRYEIPAALTKIYAPCGVIKEDTDPPQFKDGPTFQNNGDILIAGVIYNDAAYEWIRTNRLYLAQALTDQLPSTKTGQTTIGEFPREAVVLKPMLWPVQASGYTALPIWDDVWPPVDGGAYAGYEIQSMWPRAVAITAQDDAPGTASVTYLHGVTMKQGGTQRPLGPNTYADAETVPVDDFYHWRLTATDLARMDTRDRAILDASAMWCFNRRFQPGDYLVLVAMHIITKEQPDWTFQSVWWHDRPAGRYATDQPDLPEATGPWRNYLLTTTYGMTQRNGTRDQWPRGVDVSHTWPVAYNPYIELAAAHPIATNCMNCHHRAAWPSAFNVAKGAPTPNPAASYLDTDGSSLPDALDAFLDTNPIFNGLLQLDSQWAISDRAVFTGPAAR